MNEYARVLITIQMQNDSETAETCFQMSMTKEAAAAVQSEIRFPCLDPRNAKWYQMVEQAASLNASLLGYHLTHVASAEILR